MTRKPHDRPAGAPGGASAGRDEAGGRRHTDADDEAAGEELEPVEVPIDGVLDLHLFAPREVDDLVTEYLRECRERGIREVRIIHGKGTGAQRARVQRLLAKLPEVASFRSADESGGGWGATLVTLEP